MRPVKTHTFSGVRYDVDICAPIDGYCDSPRGGRPTMRIIVHKSRKRLLESCIHEALHAEGWAKTEEVVDRTAREIATFLWRLGYRKV